MKGWWKMPDEVIDEYYRNRNDALWLRRAELWEAFNQLADYFDRPFNLRRPTVKRVSQTMKTKAKGKLNEIR
jgi:hypothetical protein